MQFYFSNIIVLRFFLYEPNFLERFLWENGFLIFGGKVDIAKSQMVHWPPFWNRTSDYRYFCCIWVFLEYFTSDPNFNAKFFLKSIILMLGPYGPPLLTTNGRTEDLDYLSVKTNNTHAKLDLPEVCSSRESELPW